MGNLLRKSRPPIPLAVLALSLSGTSLGAQAAQPAQLAAPSPGNAALLDESLRWLNAPARFDADYNFELTVEIRLLLFWTAKDDVGGGYVKVGEAASDPSLEVIRLLFGSDPAKAHGINRWGAGTEVAKRGPGGAVESSAFFGFMKSSQGESAGSMQQELSTEKQLSQHRFEAVISRVDAGAAISTTVPFYSDHDFDFRELEPAERTVLGEIQQGQARTFHALEGNMAACNRSNGFLSTVQELANQALDKRPLPSTLCYVYNARQYTITLDGARPVTEKVVSFAVAGSKQKVERTYHDLEEERFHVLNRATGKKTYFALLLGTTGSLRGVPVQIDYQPNWWFRIILNLRTPDSGNSKSE
jgi:hypothetical protein